MKLRIGMVVLGVAVLLAGCATRQTPVGLNPDAFGATAGRVGFG